MDSTNSTGYLFGNTFHAFVMQTSTEWYFELAAIVSGAVSYSVGLPSPIVADPVAVGAAAVAAVAVAPAGNYEVVCPYLPADWWLDRTLRPTFVDVGSPIVASIAAAVAAAETDA